MRLRGSDARVICLTSDGEWQEGSTWEALIFAAHHKLANLLVLVDHNNLQGFGSTAEVASMSPLWNRLQGFDVDVDVIDGHDAGAIRAALQGSQRATPIHRAAHGQGQGRQLHGEPHGLSLPSAD
jgi:transketolase